MPLSRLENFLKNVDGNILYVNPTDLDATDSIENQGNSLTRPFKTIQRALLEASRFSYQVGENNDKFDRTTVLLYPGVHEIDNRPGYNVVNNSGNAVFRDRLGNVQTLNQLSETSNYNIEDPANELYKYNSVEGGVIVPRGVSLAGYDVRKTKIRPKFVPDPENLAVTRAALFRLTGGCHFWAVSFFDGNPQGSVYKDYTTSRYSPQFSHHKLTVFEYADGVNGVGIGVSTPTTDLAMYFHKIQKAFGDSSGRAIGDFPGTSDMQPALPEYEMVGPVKANDVGISSIRAGTGGTPDQTVTVHTSSSHGLVVDSPIRIAGVNTYPDIYNGNFVVSEVVGITSFKYLASAVPTDGNAWATLDGDEVVVADTDNVTGSSPYIFHCSMRSAYGMCGLHADGSKASGFKSMLVSQFTGISLQKDNNALLLYNKASGAYDTNATAPDSEKPLYLNGSSVYRPSYKNTHIKVSNDGYIQAVSIFAVGFNEHFTSSEGGDLSITNSNSNFGAVALNAKGFKPHAFNKDNRGYITHVIPPESQFKKNISIEWEAIDVTKTVAAGSSTTSKIYLDGFTDDATPPTHVVSGYRIGANNDDLLHVSIGNNTYSAQIRMQNPGGTDGSLSSKEYEVDRTGLLNSISNSVITLRTAHKLFAGESIRVVSDDGFLPSGLSGNTIYYAITNASTLETLNNNQIKLARSKNDALLGGSGNFITINNNKGGVLSVESRVSDKSPGDLAHPIQWQTSKSNWYVNVSATNALFTAVAANSGLLGQRTGKTFIKRKEDTRALNDKIYRLRYVIPKESSDARPPIPGYTLQESNTVGVAGATEFTNNIPDVTAQRNLRILKSINRDSNTGITTVVTEDPHHLVIGDAVQLRNVKSSGNSPGDLHKGFNVVIDVVGISSSKGFEVDFGTTDPGSHVAHVGRDENLPVVARWSHKDTFTVYRSETIKAHDYQRQDGVYHLICIDSSISPTVNEFGTNKFNQNITDLYPQFDADNFTMDPQHASSFAVNNPIGKVITSDLRHSLTKEFSNNFLVGNRAGYAITYAEGSTSGITTIYTNTQHNLNTILSFNSTIGGSGGSGYNGGAAGTEYNIHCTGGSGHGATVNATTNGSGAVTAVTIVDGGSGYTVGNTLTLRSGNNGATVTITSINNNIGDAIQIIGVGTDRNRYNSGFNGIHTITAVTPTTVSYNNSYVTSSGIHSSTTAGIHTGFFMLAGNAPNINAIVYDGPVSANKSGIVTVTTDEPHGLSVNNTVKIVGAAQTIYNGEHLVYEKANTTQFSFKFVEDYTTATYSTSGGKAQVLPVLYGAKGGVIDEGNERIAQRQIPIGVGIHTTLSNAAWVATNTSLTLTNSNGFKKGDYVQVDSEIIRISSAFSGSHVATVLRGQLGSRAEDHVAGSVVDKIRVLAVEKRRASVLRASGHTFEYLGYGPGNYSTSFPEKQDKILTREENFLAQAMIDNGGSVVYTGVNDAGDFHIGNKVVNSQDGTESTFNIPVPTTTGSGSAADSDSGRLDVIFDSAFIREGLTVDGNNNTTVRINAPTTITEKLTVTSENGAEFHSIDLTGGLSPSRTITYVETVPTGSGTVGDIVYKANPSFGDHIGWTYTPQGWKRFGLISTEQDADTWVIGDASNNGRLGIGTTAADRAGVNANFRGALDVRGQVVADKLLMTGISTFLGTTIFADVTIGRLSVTGNLDVTGVTTFSKFVNVGAGLTANQINVLGISTFTGSGSQVVMQYKADKTAAHTAVNHAASPAIITITAHGYSSGEKVQYVAGTTAIGGLTNNRAYYIIRQSANTFSLTATAGGSAIDLTSAGAGTHTFKLLDRSKDTGAASAATGVALTVDQINVVGVATLPADVSLTNVNLTAIAVSGLSTFTGTSDFDGAAEFAQPVTLNSTFNANADVNLGNATSDTITATGRFDSDLVPSTDNARDLGASSLEWKDLYLDGTANIDSLIADTAKVSDLTDNRVVIAGAGGELEDDADLTFDGSTLTLAGTFSHTGSATHVGDVNMRGATSGRDVLFDRSENKLRINDNAILAFGNGSDTRLLHNDSDFYINNDKGSIYIQNDGSNDDSNIYIRAKDGEDSITCEDDASVKLYWAGTSAGVRVTTTQAGVTVGGVLSGNGSGLTDLNASNISSGTINAARLPGSMGGNSASATTVNIDEDNANANRQVLFVPANSTGNVSPLIDTDNASFLYNPNTAALSGLSAVTATNFTSGGTISATTINASGTVSLNGHVNIGNATNDTVSMTAAVDSNLNPDATGNNRDLGNSVQKWRNVYGVNFIGNGSSVTHLNLGQSSNTGTIPTARLGSGTANSGTFLAGDQSYKTIDLTQLNASNLTSGTVAVARLGSSGTRNSSNYLRGDNTWASVPPGVTVNNNANNRVITGDGTSTVLNGESNLTWDNSELRIHGSGRVVRCDGNIIAYNGSDITLKDNIQPITNAVEKVLSISGNTFTWNDKAPQAMIDVVGREDTGVIAQEIEKLELPGTVQTKDDGTLGVRYEKLVPLLIEAIKELKGEIDELKSQIK